LKRVAIYLSGVNDISGGGGAERFFADLFEKYSNYKEAEYKLYFFCDQSTYDALRNVNKLCHNTNTIVLLWNVSNRYKKHIENFDFLYKVQKHKIDIVHCANFGAHDFDKLFYLSQKRTKNIPKLILNVVDCQVPYILDDQNSDKLQAYTTRYITLPNKICFDGIYSWYELFIRHAKENKYYNENTIFGSIQSRFADTSRFTPAANKKNIIVFASRMHHQKRPEWFLQAINELKNRKTPALNQWKFLFIGGGEMKKDMSQYITDNGLSEQIEMIETGDLSTIYPETSCYVSTQDFENFPSLSMMEAMACGNAVIARDVGQTSLMVKDQINGLILKDDSYLGLAKALLECMNMSTIDREQMQQNSIRQVKEVHTENNFFDQVELFWNRVIQS
jgi:glycosyltransferase involved in cell wall biosynthesis